MTGVFVFGLVMFAMGRYYAHLTEQGLREELYYARRRADAAWPALERERRWRNLFLRRRKRELGT